MENTRPRPDRTQPIVRKILAAAVLLLLAAFLAACATVPYTGRSSLNLVPDSQLISLSFSEYKKVLAKSKLSTDKADTALVRRVGRRVAAASEKFMRDNGLGAKVKDYRWEFNLIDDDKTVNAWAMPGGKIAVYSGLLPITQNETGLAVVMGHEVAHAIAKHGAERMSQGLMVQLGGMALSEAVADKPEETQALYMTAFAVGAQYGAMLPFSRQHESEADHMGLIFMALAGYDPLAAPVFWERMAALGGQAPPEFLSTHPSDATRIRQLNEHMPEALKYYRER